MSIPTFCDIPTDFLASRSTSSGGGATSGGGASSGERVESSSEDDDDDLWDDGDAEDASTRSRRRNGKGKGKGKARARSRGGNGGSGSGSGGQGASVHIKMVPDDFDTTIVAVGSDDEDAGDNSRGATSSGRIGGSTSARTTRGQARDREAAAAAAEVVKIDRNALECALCRRGHSTEHPLPGTDVGPHPVMEGSKPMWVHDACALYSPMVARDEETDALCNIASEVRAVISHCFFCVCVAVSFCLKFNLRP